MDLCACRLIRGERRSGFFDFRKRAFTVCDSPSRLWRSECERGEIRRCAVSEAADRIGKKCALAAYLPDGTTEETPA